MPCQPRRPAITKAQVRRSRATRSPATTTHGPTQSLLLTVAGLAIPSYLKVEEVHVSVDNGMDFTKAAFKICTPGNSTSPVVEVVWANNDTSVPTQVLIKDDGGIIWGEDVFREVNKNQIPESRIIRRLKPHLFDSLRRKAGDSPPRYKVLMSEERTSKLEEALNHYGEDHQQYELSAIHLFSECLGMIFHDVLHFIARTHGNLGWPVHTNRDLYKDCSILQDVKFTVSLPLPAGSTPEQTQLIMAAARAAGIPNPYPVSEPIAAYINHAKESCSESAPGKISIIVDVGAATVDRQVFQEVGREPLRICEIDVPNTDKTAWTGGSYVNEEAILLVLAGIPDVDRVLQALRKHDSTTTITDKEALARAVGNKFEKEKRKFQGTETHYLRIPGLPNIPEFRMRGGGMVVLPPEDVRKIFAKCLQSIIEMIDTAIKKVSGGMNLRSSVQHKVDDILLVGGGSHSVYLLEQIRERHCLGFGSPVTYSIQVTEPYQATKGSTTVARGGAYLSLEKELIQKRHIRRSFCVGWWHELDEKHSKARYPHESIDESEYDGRRRVFVTKFLLKQGCYPQCFSTKPVQGWRGLLPQDFDTQKDAWEVSEELYYSDTLSQDGLLISGPAIHPVPGKLCFYITKEEARNFPGRKACVAPYTHALTTK